MKRKYLIFVVVAASLIGLDQWTKKLVEENIRYRTEEIKLIDGFLSLVHAQNTGAAGGFLGDFEYRMAVFAVFTVLALVVLLQMLWQLPGDDRFQTTALGFITAGAAGNAIDRVEKQQVTDFIRVYTEYPPIAGWLHEHKLPNEWPSFNVADAAIVVGLGLFLVHFLFLEKDEKNLQADPPDEPHDIEPEQSYL